VQSFIEDHINKEFQRAYVVALGDTFHGLISITDVRKVPAERRAETWVSEIMTKAPEVETITPDEPLEAALQLIVAKDVRQLVVVRNGKPIGLVTRGDILRVLEIAELLPPMPEGRAAPSP
jgi:CBS domain-containing protein